MFSVAAVESMSILFFMLRQNACFKQRRPCEDWLTWFLSVQHGPNILEVFSVGPRRCRTVTSPWSLNR